MRMKRLTPVLLLLAGILLALPNMYGSMPAIQIADNKGAEYDAVRMQEYVRVVENTGVSPEAAYLKELVRLEPPPDALTNFVTAERQKTMGAVEQFNDIQSGDFPTRSSWVQKCTRDKINSGQTADNRARTTTAQK